MQNNTKMHHVVFKRSDSRAPRALAGTNDPQARDRVRLAGICKQRGFPASHERIRLPLVCKWHASTTENRVNAWKSKNLPRTNNTTTTKNMARASVAGPAGTSSRAARCIKTAQMGIYLYLLATDHAYTSSICWQTRAGSLEDHLILSKVLSACRLHACHEPMRASRQWPRCLARLTAGEKS